MSKTAKGLRTSATSEFVRPGREKNYKLWIISYHGNALKPIRTQFVKRVTDGLRRNVFVVDLDSEMSEKTSAALRKTASTAINGKKKKASSVNNNGKESKGNEYLPMALSGISSCRQKYDYISEVIDRETKFDILEYWKQDLPIVKIASEKSISVKKGAAAKGGKTAKGSGADGDKTAKQGRGDTTAKGRGDTTAKGKGDTTAKGKGGGKTAKQKSAEEIPKIICPQLFPKLHNKVGRPAKLSIRKYIEDWPAGSKLFIVFIINDQESAKKLYVDLMSRFEPIQGIIHYLPQESAYDILLPQKSAKAFLLDTWEEIQHGIYHLRQINSLKPVGMFQQLLPVISNCLAEKLTHQIFDDLTWYLYDLEVLYQHYNKYYVNEFKVTNVTIDKNVNIADLRAFAESLSIQGHFLQSPNPAMITDIATVTMYLESLLSTIEQPPNLLGELDMLLLATPSHRSITGTHSIRVADLMRIYKYAFHSITRIKRYNRLIVEECNKLLLHLVRYTNIIYFQHIYHCCLEYNTLRNYVVHSPIVKCARINNPFEVEFETINLPQLCEYFSTKDGARQSLTKIFQKYEEYQVDVLLPNMKLYRFKRPMDEVIEKQEMITLPSRLCFRDFTLFQMEEFLENLVTPEMREVILEAKMSLYDDPEQALRRLEAEYNIDDDIFIRPNSLKARRQSITDPPSTRVRITTSRTQSTRSKKSAAPELRPSEVYVGLPSNHPLLKGYNLEDIRQEVTLKTSSYYFDEGILRFYEDRHCFTDLNKTIFLKIDQCKLHLIGERNNLDTISHNIHLRSSNKIRCRLLNKQNEFPKVVLNYPNGLVVHYNDKDCEQTWLPQETFKEERRRIMTPDGSVIVFYKAEDLIRIMRYNGEVYELYQFEAGYGEEEGEEENDEFADSISKQSNINTPSVKEVSSKHSGKKDKEIKVSEDDNKENTQKKKKSKKKSKKSNEGTSETEDKSATSQDKLYKTSVDYLKEVFENELRYLNKIMETYCLTFVHLKITTTVGRIIHLKRSGHIYEKTPLSMVEWHDYYANESYAMRGDGVKLIWTKDELKCYHEDKTLIRCQMEDVVLNDSQILEEIEMLISESSSHDPSSMPATEVPSILIDDLYDLMVKAQALPKNANKTPEQLFNELSIKRERYLQYLNYLNQKKSEREEGQEVNVEEDYTYFLEKDIEEEMPAPKDVEYVVFHEHSYWAHQEYYATTHFKMLCAKVETDNFEMEVFAADNINIQVVPEDIFQREKDEDEYVAYGSSIEDEEEKPKLHSILKKPEVKDPFLLSSYVKKDTISPDDLYFLGVEGEQEETPMKYVIKIQIGEDFSVKVTEDVCRIDANMERYDEEANGKVLDSIMLKFNFTEKAVDIFNKLANCISEFKNYPSPVCREKMFLEVLDEQFCTARGFSFVNKPRLDSGYAYEGSNTISVLTPLHSILDNLIIPIKSYEKDMTKFPRFRKRPSRRSIAESFPRVTSLRVYVKIPKQLANTDEVEKFVQPFDTITFKRMRRQMKENIVYHTKPQIRIEMQKLMSRYSWARRQIYHQARLLTEMQRKGLYHAMLKHNTFPNYQKFRDRFDYHVKHIDFFDFMIDKCSEEALKKKKEQELLAAERNAGAIPKWFQKI